MQVNNIIEAENGYRVTIAIFNSPSFRIFLDTITTTIQRKDINKFQTVYQEYQRNNQI